jgi:hypothetical protein
VDITVLDDAKRSYGCGSKSQVDVPAGSSIKSLLEGCGQRKTGSEFKVDVRINYDVLNPSGAQKKTLMGVLSGVVD